MSLFALALVSVVARNASPGAPAAANELAVKAGVRSSIEDDVALVCAVGNTRNFEGYPVPGGVKPFVVSLTWDVPGGWSVFVLLDEGDSSRMSLLASGARYSPKAVGDDNPPPPPPGGRPPRKWGRVSGLLPFREGGRSLMMLGGWPRDFLFEVPAGTTSAEALRFEVRVRERSYAIRCDLGR